MTDPIEGLFAPSAFPLSCLGGAGRDEAQAQARPGHPGPGADEGFFEVHAENYMGAGGPPHRMLAQIRADYPVSLHSICMSIGGNGRARSVLLIMTGIVELTVPDGWPVHITWVAMVLALMAWGPGRLSIDHAIPLIGSRRL
jgi:hypothetical protein